MGDDATASPSGGRLFTQEMRSSTRSVHDASDKLVNLKLGLTLSDSKVWYEGLMVFQPIFSFLDDALERHAHTLLGELKIEGLRRSEAFVEDLNHFYGDQTVWEKDVESRPPIQKYLDHLKQIEDENPYLLIAYIYHLYMGLLSGGQILSKKRSIKKKFGSDVNDEEPGNAVTQFTHPIGNLKKKLRDATNKVAEDLDESTKKEILEEGVKVFQLNIEIIRSIEGIDEIFWRKMIWWAAIAAIIIAVVGFIFFGRS